MKFEGPKYGRYMEEDCCTKCEYAGGYLSMGSHSIVPPMPISICPDCGGKLSPIIGRWYYSVKITWWGMEREMIKHSFVRGEEVLGTPPPPDPDNNYTLEDSINAYKAGHPHE